MRVVSLIPSSTEIVCALGQGDTLVGRSHECDFPESVKSLPVCSESKFNPQKGSSREIDHQVKMLIQQTLSVYRVDAEKLKALKPDVIVTQDHCNVCAVNLSDVEKAVSEWMDAETRIVALKPSSIDQVFKGFVEVAEALGDKAKGEALVKGSRARMAEIAAKARVTGKRPSVMFLEWYDPLMAAGNWMPEFTEMLGAKDVFGIPGDHAPKITFKDVVAKDPDVIMLMACGWTIERNLQELPLLQKQPGWKDLKAVKNGKIYATEGNQYFNRPGPRLVDSLEILAEVLFPEAFAPAHQGSGWIKVEKP